MTPRRFPPTWTVIELVQDAGGQTVGWFPTTKRPPAKAKVLTRDEARRMAVNFARLYARVYFRQSRPGHRRQWRSGCVTARSDG
jgi:hypothetical protein